ncbi:chemotaxis protein [Bradyrhizobium sp. HKCCYLRH3099]|uniref:chemotaxis protein n=1 Tax=unclassified Bradyrhizobium TaxID=2631580 RepID=UPI003EC08BC6
MAETCPREAIRTSLAAIDDVSSYIEETFLQAGQRLGRGQAIFQELNHDLAALASGMSGTEIEQASSAVRDIANRLDRLAQALPAETALLGRLRQSAAEAAGQLRTLFKHVQTISIIARSARIEAASLEGDRDNFLAFTRQAHEIAGSVKQLLEACARDQDLLAKAVEAALDRQSDFDQRYRTQLLATGEELIAAYSVMHERRGNSLKLAESAGGSTQKIAQAVARSIVSLQAGDSTRQRLEHIRWGLELAGRERGVTDPESRHDLATLPTLLCRLQSMQLDDAKRELQNDTAAILHALSSILSDATGVIGQGRSLYGDQGDDAVSVLARAKQVLAQASTLIATCERAGTSVDDALLMVEELLGRFRVAVAALLEAVLDITLIGMNASLKAGHLGSRGSAFVVIANELRATADLVAAGAGRLKTALEVIETLALELRALRLEGEPAQLAGLEPAILDAINGVESGNARLGTIVDRLIREGAEFEELMGSVRQLISHLDESTAELSSVAAQLNASSASAQGALPTASDQAAFDDALGRYTMEREREVHRRFLSSFGLVAGAPSQDVDEVEADDGVLLF